MRGFETAWRLEGCRNEGNENEDRVGICEAPEVLVLVVADGVHALSATPLSVVAEGDEGLSLMSGGGVASRRAIEIVRKAITGERPNDDAQVWVERLAGIDRMLSRDKKAGETAMVVASVVTTGRTVRIVGASAGGAEAWLITPTGIEVLTRRQARKPFLGSSAALPVPFEREWEEGTLLLGTDGLFKYADRERLLLMASTSDIEQAAQHLLDLPRLPDGSLPDDVGLLLCRREHRDEPKAGKAGSLLQTVGKLMQWGRRDSR